MTVKKMRRVAEEPSPSPSCAPYGDDARKRFRFQSLSQDYTEFLEETEEKERRLLEARLRKRKLLAEVRFLRRKLETLFANPYQQVRLKALSSTTPVVKLSSEKKPKVSEATRTSSYRVDSLYTNASQYQFKKRTQKKPTKSVCVEHLGLFIPREAPPQNMMVREAANACTSAILGANEVPFKNGEELNKFQLEQYHMQMERLNRVPMIGGGSNGKLAICRDLGNISKKIGKRKLSWRDPLVLKA